MREASRCLGYKKPLCRDGCPVGVPIPEFLALVARGDFIASADKIKEANALPPSAAVCVPKKISVRVLCFGEKFEPVAIGRCEGL